jgi:hypothetical protein
MMHGIHEIMINYFKRLLRQVGNPNDYADYFDKVNQLKRLRIQADYQNKDITSVQSQKAIELAKELMHILNKL